MKKYDFTKAKELIELHEDLIDSASLGMHEDWFWTAQTVWDGEWKTELNNDTVIGGINGSTWATPTLALHFKDSTTKMIEVSMIDKGDNDDYNPLIITEHGIVNPLLGCLSGPVQELIPQITEHHINESNKVI